MNAAGAAAGHIFAEVWRWAERQGARPESLIGLAGTGDLVATALAPQSRNRRAGELLAQGVSAVDIPARVGQAVEALETVPLLARALTAAGIDAPVTTALGRLISGELPLEQWVALVRATVPPPARWRPAVRPGFGGAWAERSSLRSHAVARKSTRCLLDPDPWLSRWGRVNIQKEEAVPQIIVLADSARQQGDDAVMLRERVSSSDLKSDHSLLGSSSASAGGERRP